MRKLSLSLILVVVTAVIGLGWLITEINYRNAVDGPGLEGELAAYHRMGREIALVLDGLPEREAVLRQWQSSSSFGLTLQDRSGFPVPPELVASFQDTESLVLQADTNVSLHFLMPASSQVLSLVIPNELVDDERPLTSLVLTLAFYGCMIVILLAWLYPLIRRLLVLGRTAQAFGNGDLASRVKTGRFSGIADIEVQFNRMADRIQGLLADNKLLSRAVSHDLKTPLARLRFGIDTWEETEDSALRRKYCERINRDLAEMESLVETLLDYARLDESGVQLQRQKIALGTFVTQLFENLECPGKRLCLVLADEDTTVDVDPNYLAIQLNNLMSNALRHACSQVKVSVAAAAGCVSLVVEDDGNGIPVEERENVIKPFWRGKDIADSRGHGMGLAIVVKIAEWFDTSVVIEDSGTLGGAAIGLHFRCS